MESTPVLIIGAGPSGMALGLTLAKYNIKSTILERDLEVTHDPRGVVLNGDALRIAYDIGLGEDIPRIGQAMGQVYFHKNDFQAKPFFSMDLTPGLLHQGLPSGILMSQPKFEQAMEKLVSNSTYCDLRRGCTAQRQKLLPDGCIVTYEDSTGNTKQIRCSWLVGADGKTGVVRKHFLERQHDIRQEAGIFEYKGTWIAANLHMNLPTPQSHPELPFWGMNMTPQQVYDLYWPTGWHFCGAPGKPTATGRFGTHEDRLWRHEFAEEPWDDSKDAEKLFWDHITPMITRNSDQEGRPFPSGPVTYPRDCIEIWRCRPYTFVHKVVNKWFAKRTILIGDAAHVFPPFAGQGIACGVRDAHQLAWRLALHLRSPNMSDSVTEDLLTAWAKERRQGVDDAARLTIANGQLVNEPESWGFFVYKHVAGLLQKLPFRKPSSSDSEVEAKGFKPTPEGFFIPGLDGGGKIPQAPVAAQHGEAILSDQLLRPQGSAGAIFTILSIKHNDIDPVVQRKYAQSVIKKANLDVAFVDESSVYMFDDTPHRGNEEPIVAEDGALMYSPLPEAVAHRSKPFDGRLPPSARFAILRPDFYIYAVARDLKELEAALGVLKARLGSGSG